MTNADGRDESWDFPQKREKKKEKKERTSSFRGSFEERETMLLDEKQLGGREM